MYGIWELIGCFVFSHRRGNWIADKMKRLLKNKDRPSKGPGEAPRFLKPPTDVEPESPSKGNYLLFNEHVVVVLCNFMLRKKNNDS